MASSKSIIKSTRHQKIIGNYGERLICNWLSRSNFEVAIIDHTGIDIIAYNRKTKKRLGITVKSRTRTERENESVNVLSNRERSQDRKKVEAACKSFNCDPWIGIYVETESEADVYLTSLKHYDQKYRIKGKVVDDWKMSKNYRAKYESDAKVMHIHIDFTFNLGGTSKDPLQWFAKYKGD
ncbi:MAG: hypothetical protein DRP56_10185 [Planctomycetota bacterium]|nr:MAG: hypothetical protein DRP56_10185 [Planctomycetota bacterium]